MRDPLTGRWLGRVKWYSPEKGYGFIIRGDGEEIFFHRSGVLPPGPAYLTEGTPVTFEMEETLGAKPKAVEVALVTPPTEESEETLEGDTAA
ncbi:MAG: cold-shock protein [Chloroflexota bacterium]